MKKFASVLLFGLLLASCGGNQARAKRPEAPVAPKEYTYSVRAVYPHPTTSYTQGLQFADGLLWEGDTKGDGDLSRGWLRSRANSIEGGTSEINLNIIAKRVLELPGA